MGIEPTSSAWKAEIIAFIPIPHFMHAAHLSRLMRTLSDYFSRLPHPILFYFL